MTCRVAANEYQFTDFKYAEVADFNENQVNEFVNKWFSNIPQVGNEFKGEFNKSANRGLRDLATNPILLSLVCLAYQETREFPAGRRVEIYKQAVDALMRKWDILRGVKRDFIYKNLLQAQKENLIAYVATKTFEMGEFFVKEQTLVGLIETFLQKLSRNKIEERDGKVVLRAVEAQHGIWVERARDIFSFSHLSLQEFFAAQYIKNSASTDAVKKLLDPNHIGDDRWREVILNTSGLLGDAEEFIQVFERAVRK